MNLNEHLAVNVMGWHKHVPENPYDLRMFWADKDNNITFLINRYDPTENIEQAFMCLEKFDGYKIEHFEKNYYIEIKKFDLAEDDYEHFPEVSDISLPKAIALACARATGWEESA